MLLEVKTATGKLNARQVRWHKAWYGQVSVVRSPMQAIEVVQQHVKNYQIR